MRAGRLFQLILRDSSSVWKNGFCTLGLTGCVVAFFMMIVVWLSIYQRTETLESAISETALSSVTMFYRSQEHNGSDDFDKSGQALMAATRDFRKTSKRLVAVVQGEGRPDTSFWQTPLAHIAWYFPMGQMPKQIHELWRDSSGGQTTQQMMQTQFKTCRDLCMDKTMSPAERDRELGRMNDLTVGQLLPRFQALRQAASDWQNQILVSLRFVIMLACLCMIAAIFLVRYLVLGPILRKLDSANESLNLRNSALEEKVAERTADLTQALADANVAHEARTRFLANVNHEMRTPLNGVLGVAALLHRTDLTPKQNKLVDTIIQSGKILVRLVDDVLDYVSLGSGKLVVHPRPTKLPVVMDEALELLRPGAEEKGLQFLVDLRNVTTPWVEIDSDRLVQIVNNIVGNAIKFTASGHVSVTLSQEPSTIGTCTSISVTDTGLGISDAEQSRMFEVFERGRLDEPTAGTGLGLPITKSLVDHMGGQIHVDSEPGLGSRFVVVLDLPVSSAQAAA